MSSKGNSKKKKSKRGVRFTEESIANGSERVAAAAPSIHRTNHGNDNDDVDFPPRKRHKRARQDRPNPDEIDDIDEYVAGGDNDGDDDVNGLDIPSESTTLRTKRERRLKQAQENGDIDDGANIDDDDNIEASTRINQDTSLAAEGIEIEPFHMNQENSDGTGYFDGDTYVFRDNKGDAGEEPDAWLDSIQGNEEELAESLSSSVRAKAAAKANNNDADDDDDDETNTNSGDDNNNLDNWTNEELYAQIIPLVSDNETVMQAIARYGNLLKQQKGNKQSATAATDNANNNLAKKSLDDLTGAASALLLKGHLDIYQKTRNDLSALLPVQQEQESASNDNDNNNNNNQAKDVVQWEYQGSQDHAIHGPFTTQQMQGWIQQGYFVGPSAVMIRTIRQQEAKVAKDDLLSDLLDDDEDDDGEDVTPQPKKTVKGEWVKSDEVNFSTYA